MDKFKFGIVSLGCDKNRIDSEIVINTLKENYEIVNNPKEADILIVNTCGFIESSKQESINTILEMAEYKKEKCKVLVVTGCLSQRYGKELQNLMPEVDILLGVNDYDKLQNSIEVAINKKEKSLFCNYSDSIINEGKRTITTPKHYAYLRIAEGCNNFCTYCAIPRIRGRYRSRKIEDIIEEAKYLESIGVKELIIVAQDTTRYGTDIYNKKMLPKLIQELSKIEGIKWIRLLYCYPEEIDESLIYEIAHNKKVCKYLDIPIQHISNNVLKAMGRRGTKKEIIDVIEGLRKNIPDIVLRTSIIVGFPGEEEEDFNELKSFIKDIKFDKLGVFKYSKEEDTPASLMENQISEDIKKKREEEIMLIQRKISENINKRKVGSIYDVIVEEFNDGTYIGRSCEMSPEIDGEIYFKCDKILNVGDIVPIKIKESLEYDLIGVVCYESGK